jgi:hypothetical protein
MTGAQAPGALRANTSGHRAGRTTEHRITRVEDQILGPELRSNCRHQFRQQPDRPTQRTSIASIGGVVAAPLSRVRLAVHGCTGSSSNTVAVNRTRTRFRSAIACR